jgi:hypothetical protein
MAVETFSFVELIKEQKISKKKSEKLEASQTCPKVIFLTALIVTEPIFALKISKKYRSRWDSN